MDQFINLAHEVAHQAGDSSLLSALGIDVRMLLLQGGAFLILVIILGKFAYPPILKAIEEHRRVIEEGRANAKKAEEQLEGVEEKVAEIIRSARGEANEIIAHGQKEATALVEAAEARALKRAEHIVDEAQARMKSELTAAQESMKKEMAELVASATEHIIKEKIDVRKDAALIAASLKEAK
jgi:F-type H+-transporting ATPase subunit b